LADRDDDTPGRAEGEDWEDERDEGDGGDKRYRAARRAGVVRRRAVTTRVSWRLCCGVSCGVAAHDDAGRSVCSYSSRTGPEVEGPSWSEAMSERVPDA
jgi:hypothetical protein